MNGKAKAAEDCTHSKTLREVLGPMAIRQVLECAQSSAAFRKTLLQGQTQFIGLMPLVFRSFDSRYVVSYSDQLTDCDEDYYYRIEGANGEGADCMCWAKS